MLGVESGQAYNHDYPVNQLSKTDSRWRNVEHGITHASFIAFGIRDPSGHNESNNVRAKV